jgi:hypothetical protein
VVQGVEQSSEYLTDLVNNLYQTYLNRSADPTGLSAFLTDLESGITIEQLKAAILGSPEYYQDQGGTNTDFLQGLQAAILSRAPDSAGEQAWLTNLQNGLTNTQVAEGVLISTEADHDFVTADYQQYLNVSPDPPACPPGSPNCNRARQTRASPAASPARRNRSRIFDQAFYRRNASGRAENHRSSGLVQRSTAGQSRSDERNSTRLRSSRPLFSANGGIAGNERDSSKKQRRSFDFCFDLARSYLYNGHA